MKKILALLFAMSLVVLLAACSSNSEPAPTTQAPAVEQEVKEEKVEPTQEAETTETTSLNPDGAYNVILVDSGTEALSVLATIRNELGLDLTGAKALVDSVPSVIAEQLSLADAEALKATIEEKGAVLELLEVEKVEAPATTGIKVVLTDSGVATLNVVKEVRDQLNLGLAEAKDLVDNIPSVLAENITVEEAEALKEALEAVGATVEIQ